LPQTGGFHIGKKGSQLEMFIDGLKTQFNTLKNTINNTTEKKFSRGSISKHKSILSIEEG
jgi:hypothetical protein